MNWSRGLTHPRPLPGRGKKRNGFCTLDEILAPRLYSRATYTGGDAHATKGFDRFEPFGRSKLTYEIRPRCAKSTGKQGVFVISARDKIRGFVPSNRVCHFVVKTVITRGALSLRPPGH